MNDGDWICTDANCGNINFARRNSCYRCNKERPNGKPYKKKLGTEIGKSAAEKSRGLFNADDWQCNKCANVNWARRQTCNVCNAPKFGEVEARTGYGGGYNERGVVEYRRREPSSDDEYDEFGRRKRKRRSESDDKVGITEGPVNKKLPSAMLQEEIKTDVVMPVPPPSVNMLLKKDIEKVNGSLSDGSVCELPPLNKIALRRNQFQNQPNYYRADIATAPYKTNGTSRKRYFSSGDKDQTGSSGYETSSKVGRSDNSVSPALKTYNPVMENRVSSTNNDVIYKFTGQTAAEDFEVTYTLEERVKAAAFAIVYNNCKICTDKFEMIYDKPAPDFKTIFAWRQRLITTGCLIDTHLDTAKKDTERSSSIINNKMSTNNRKKSNITTSNPDEIAIISDTDDDCLKSNQIHNHPLYGLRQKSISTDTLLIGGIDSEARVAGASSIDDRMSQGRSQSASTHHRTRSSSRDSQDSNYPDSDLDQNNLKALNRRKSPPPKSNTRHSVNESDSDSYSYNSDDVDFRSRVFGDKKIKRKVKKRSNPSSQTAYSSNDNQSYSGYNTIKNLEQSPLVTGNIYTVNLRNMNVVDRRRHQDNDHISEPDGCSSEYVPTRLAATAKKNYQDFKNNVKKRGFWAKGNGSNFSSNAPNNNSTATTAEISSAPLEISRKMNDYFTDPVENEPIGYVSTQIPNTASRAGDFTKDEVVSNQPTIVDQYLPFDKPVCMLSNNKSSENSFRVFDIVQSNSANKNKSIMDIFGDNEQSQDSSETNKEIETAYSAKRRYETLWDEDDDALYKNSDSIEMPVDINRKRTPSPPSIGSLRTQSPITDMLYASSNDIQKDSGTQLINQKVIKEKQDMLLGLLEDMKDTREKNCLGQKVPNKINHPKMSQCESMAYGQPKITHQQNITSPLKMHLNCLTQKPQPIPASLPEEEIRCNNEENRNTHPTIKTNNNISPSKKVHILESITIKSDNIMNNKSQIHDNLLPHVTEGVHVEKEQPKEVNTQQTFTVPETNTNNNLSQISSQIDISNLLSNINTNTLLLALQNLQHLSQKPNDIPKNDTRLNGQDDCNNKSSEKVETINLTNDEDWEKESNIDESIERELEKLDGNTGDTPFLSDIFDPGPVVLPSNINKKLHINLKNSDENKKNQTPHINESAPVIGNFKSFALPKPILLNRLKLTVKQTDKSVKDGRRGKRSKKPRTSASQEEQGGEEEEEEESGDDADLSKYDLWGSDGEEGNSSKMDNDDKQKEEPKDGSSNTIDKNGKLDSTKGRKRSRSSSSSSTSSSSSSSSHSSSQAPKNKFDDFNLNSERESQHGSPKARKSRSRSRSRSRSPRSRSAGTPRRKSRDSRSAGESRSHESSRDKERSRDRDRDRRDRSRGARDPKERRYSRDGNHYSARGRHR